ncbi:MAG: T9SS type A sorting domain-containing protein [Candidatus Delongbacteria bacterium]|jgi:hypothetical protein|nr:T9SS type A sorting domain-containing protein [Candidatus Delongbacteria bacterium]
MKKSLSILGLTFLLICNVLYAQTTVSDGDWTNPSTWGGTLPMGTGTVVINHNVTLDTDYSHTSGTITINASGTLTSSSPGRGFSLNYPNGTANLTVDGTFQIARTMLNSGIVTNNGTIDADSLLNSASLINADGATIEASQFMNNTGGMIENQGQIIATNFLNLDTCLNYSEITTTDLHNSKYFNNAADGNITVNHDFSNSDTLASPADFINDGMVEVYHNWRNTQAVSGSGRFCIQNNTNNAGDMSGDFDFCDVTGENIDLNTGTIAGTITFCLYPCFSKITSSGKQEDVSVFPNPSGGILHIQSTSELAKVEIKNILGKNIYSSQPGKKTFKIDLSNLTPGIYIIMISDKNKILKTEKIIIN